MRLISWNVNGLRAVCNKNFYDFFDSEKPDILCLQETKLQEGQISLKLPDDYKAFWSYAVRKGYSGTATLTRIPVLSAKTGVGSEDHDNEGRAVTTEFDDFFLVNIYSPNSQDQLARIDFRLAWEDALLKHIQQLDKTKPVIICGDMNVARTPIDLVNPKGNDGTCGYSEPERNALERLLSEGALTDSFRLLHPDATGAYTWWSYRYRAREKNNGWRIDYFLVSNRLAPRIKSAEILKDVFGSDHCPIAIEIE